jgi:hypothetical protein
MKVRTGFISNSSSTSFCIIGFSIKDFDLDSENLLADLFGLDSDDTAYQKAEQDGIEIVLEGTEAPLLGMTISKGSSSDDGGYLEDRVLSLYELEEIRRKALDLRQKFVNMIARKSTGLTIQYPEIKIYIGSKLC